MAQPRQLPPQLDPEHRQNRPEAILRLHPQQVQLQLPPPVAPRTQAELPRSNPPPASLASSIAASPPPTWQPTSATERTTVRELHISQNALSKQEEELSHRELSIQNLEREKTQASERYQRALSASQDSGGISASVTESETLRIQQHKDRETDRIKDVYTRSLSHQEALEHEQEAAESLYLEASVIAKRRGEPLTQDHLALAEATHTRNLFTDSRLGWLKTPRQPGVQSTSTKAEDRSAAAYYELSMLEAQKKLDAAKQQVDSQKGQGTPIKENMTARELETETVNKRGLRYRAERDFSLQRLADWCTSERDKIPEKISKKQEELTGEAASQKKKCDHTVTEADKKIGEHKSAITELRASITSLSENIASLGKSITGFIEKFSASFSKKTSATPEDSSKSAGAPLTSAPDSTTKPETEAPTLKT